MKNLRKLKLNENFLSEEELKQLKGGANKNLNTREGCSCTYYDGKRTINSNQRFDCSCTCLY